MEATVIVTFLALGQFVLFGIQVGSLRTRLGVIAPATTGHEEFERMFRVHQNTLEQLVVFLPALWLQAFYSKPIWGAVVGLVYVVGRFVYRAEYLRDPASRGTGFAMTFIPSMVLLIWALVAAVLRIV
jgi:hypothetical protein